MRRGRPPKSVINWTQEASLIPHRKELKRVLRLLDNVLEDFGSEFEYQGLTPKQVQERLQTEFLNAAHEVLKEES